MLVERSAVLATAQHLWPGTEHSPKFIRALEFYMNSKMHNLGCCVMYDLSRDFRIFLNKYENLPDIKRREVVLTSNGALRLVTDYRYSKSFKVFSNTSNGGGRRSKYI